MRHAPDFPTSTSNHAAATPAQITCAALARELPGIYRHLEEIDRRLRSGGRHRLPHAAALNLEERNFARLEAIEALILATEPRDLADVAAVAMISAVRTMEVCGSRRIEHLADQIGRQLLAIAIACARAAEIDLTDFSFSEYSRSFSHRHDSDDALH